jgi:hypothetical protein
VKLEPHFRKATMMAQRVDYIKQSPELFKKFVEFSLAVKASVIHDSIRASSP